jgi:hypothetical protein
LEFFDLNATTAIPVESRQRVLEPAGFTGRGSTRGDTMRLNTNTEEEDFVVFPRLCNPNLSHAMTTLPWACDAGRHGRIPA